MPPEKEHPDLDAISKAALDLFREGADEVTVQLEQDGELFEMSITREPTSKWRSLEWILRKMKRGGRVFRAIKKAADEMFGEDGEE